MVFDVVDSRYSRYLSGLDQLPIFLNRSPVGSKVLKNAKKQETIYTMSLYE